MTFSIEDSGADVGIWKIENGVLILETYWEGDTGSTETGTESWVFSDATHAKVYFENNEDADINITAISDITGADLIPVNFTADLVPYRVSVDTLAGIRATVGDSGTHLTHSTIYFYENMTFKNETHDDLGNPETITGSWSVEEGVVIVDIVYSDTESEHLVLIFDEAPAVGTTFSAMEIVSNASTRETGIEIIDISAIPPEASNSAVSPAVIMYLLN